MRRPAPRPHATTAPALATIVATGLFVGGLLSGVLAGHAAVARVQDPYADVDLFARVLSTVERDYVEEMGSDDLIDAAIRGMVDHLDSQSRWLDDNQLRDLRDDAEGTTTGLGIEVDEAAAQMAPPAGDLAEKEPAADAAAAAPTPLQSAVEDKDGSAVPKWANEPPAVRTTTAAAATHGKRPAPSMALVVGVAAMLGLAVLAAAKAAKARRVHY